MHGVHIYNGTLLGRGREWVLAICGSMEGPGRYSAEWGMSRRERHLQCDFAHRWNFKNKIDSNKLIDTENILLVASSKGGWGRGCKRGRHYEVHIGCYKYSWGCRVYNTRNVVNNTVMPVHGLRTVLDVSDDRWEGRWEQGEKGEGIKEYKWVATK